MKILLINSLLENITIKILKCPINSSVYNLSQITTHVSDLAHEKLMKSEPVIIPNKVLNHLFATFYGIITGSLSAKFSS